MKILSISVVYEQAKLSQPPLYSPSINSRNWNLLINSSRDQCRFMKGQSNGTTCFVNSVPRERAFSCMTVHLTCEKRIYIVKPKLRRTLSRLRRTRMWEEHERWFWTRGCPLKFFALRTAALEPSEVDTARHDPSALWKWTPPQVICVTLRICCDDNLSAFYVHLILNFIIAISKNSFEIHQLFVILKLVGFDFSYFYRIGFDCHSQQFHLGIKSIDFPGILCD